MKLSAPVTGGPCWAEPGTTGLESAKRFRTRLVLRDPQGAMFGVYRAAGER
ncbi:hypothetical protein ACFVZC_08895 [Streptomyces marokkonensis]|uniref:Uncharacterized protein n=1 Tax=Streptomyces marokkonensis TaxID=324855 RepID=A0ABW6Q2X6_9ACTN